jgi:hypothetical protein
VVWIEEVGEQMHALLAAGGRTLHQPRHARAAAVQAAGEFHTGQQGHRGQVSDQRLARLGVADRGVVVGERHHVKADSTGWR